MIHDLDLGDSARNERRPAWLLPAVAALCVLAFIGAASASRGQQEPVPAAPARAVVPSLPPGWEAARAAERGASLPPAAAPVPRLVESPDGGILSLPAESYSAVTRLPNAVSGSSAPQEPLLQYRYRLNDGRFVVLARVPKTDPYRGLDPSAYTASGVQVRDTDARVLVATGASQLVVVVWTEGIRSYQLSSSTLSVAELVTLAGLLR